jgi:O-antigen ligase
LWVLLPLTVPALVLTESRAAWLALICSGIVMIGDRFAVKILILGLLTTFMVGLFFLAPGSHIDDGGIERISLWRDTIAALTPFGHGLGSFWESFPAHANHFNLAAVGTRPDHPHNELLWLAYEGGFPAVVLFAVLAVCLFRQSEDASRGVLVCLGVLSLFAMPFHDPGTVILGSLCAGWAAAARDRIRDVAVDRGSPVFVGVERARCAAGHG